jgi:hypothetical protein
MTENRFITSVTVTPANVTDDKEAASLYEQQEKKPETLTGDGLYGTGENREYFKEKGCQLIAPLRGQENKTKLWILGVGESHHPGFVNSYRCQSQKLHSPPQRSSKEIFTA